MKKSLGLKRGLFVILMFMILAGPTYYAAKTDLSNLAATTVVNSSLVSDTDSTDDLGSSAIRWANAYVDTLTLTNALGVANGGTGVTTSTGSGANVLGTSPTFTTQLTTPKIVSSGNQTIDAVNAAANSTVTVTNSDATYKANLSVEGNITLSGGQIAFPASQNASADANTLDDYEEGTWTPTITFAGGTTGITYSAQDGSYIKDGSKVTLWGRITLSNKGSSTGQARISNFPFTIANTNTAAGGGTLGFLYNITFANQIFTSLTTNSTYCSMLESTEAGGIADITDSDFANTSNFNFCITYRVDF